MATDSSVDNNLAANSNSTNPLTHIISTQPSSSGTAWTLDAKLAVDNITELMSSSASDEFSAQD